MDGAGNEQQAFSNDIYNQRQSAMLLPASFVLALLLEASWLLWRATRRRNTASGPAA